MPSSNGTITKLRAYFDEKAGRHKLEATPESLRICKSKTRVAAIVATNETVGTQHYRPIVLGYSINGGATSANSKNPKDAFEDSPNASGVSFLAHDDGKPNYFLIKDRLGIEPRKEPCSFPDSEPGKYAVVVRFSHEGWDDAEGAGNHYDWHFEC